MKIEIWSDWILRMECDSFIMVVNKNTGEYKNLYRNTFTNQNQIEQIALLLDRHKNMK